MTALEAALRYIAANFFPIPVPYRQKGPTLQDWQNLRITAETASNYFNSQAQNIGILLGEPNNLADVDLDAPESHWAWIELGPATSFRFGRKSNPSSHRFFRTTTKAARTMKYIDPEAPEGGKGCLIELRSLAAHGKAGLQTNVPPSTHVSGEPIEFDRDATLTPAEVAPEVLEAAVRRTAAAVLIGRHAKNGSYHDTFLAIAGAAARNGWSQEEAQAFLRACYRVIWESGADLEAAEKEAESTYRRYKETQDVTSLHTLQGLIPLPVFRRFTQWLGLRADADEAAVKAAKKAPLLLPTGTILNQEITPQTYLIDDLLTTPGLYLVIAPPRAGKTVLAVQIAMTIANGLSLFENFKTRSAPTLILEWDDEQGVQALQAFLKKARAYRPNMPFHAVIPEEFGPDRLNLGDPEFFPWFIQQLEICRPGLVILDSYTALRGHHSHAGDIVKIEAEEVAKLAAITRQFNLVMLLIHHNSKSSAHLDWDLRGAGSYAIAMTAGGVIHISRYPELPEKDGARLLLVRSRRSAGAEMALRFQPETLDFDLILEGPAARDYPELVQLHREFPDATFKIADITAQLGWARPTIYRVLNRLVLSGVLNKPSTGVWKWSPNFYTKYL